MSTADQITAIGVLIAVLTFIYTLWQYLRDQRQQRAAQTREDLQAIVCDCNLFFRPLNQDYPYPILHTAAAITKEFRSRLKKSPEPEDVSRLLRNEELLRSICVDGWVSSTQILRMMDIVEKLESRASSRNLQGRLLLICEASFLLASLVSELCSSKFFFDELCQSRSELHPMSKDDVADILNTITVRLQKRMCDKFSTEYKQYIELSLEFIQKAVHVFIVLKDSQLRHLGKTRGEHRHFFHDLFSHPKRILEYLAKMLKEHVGLSAGTNPNKGIVDPIGEIRRADSPSEHLKKMMEYVNDLQQDISDQHYQELCALCESLKPACELYEKLRKNTTEERTR